MGLKAILVSQNPLRRNVRFKVSNLNGLISHVQAIAECLGLSASFLECPCGKGIYYYLLVAEKSSFSVCSPTCDKWH